MGTGHTSLVLSTPLTPHHLQWVRIGSCHLFLEQLLFWNTYACPIFFLPYSQALLLLDILITRPVMPWERGKPKRGPSYYNFVSRQRRLHLFSPSQSTSLVRLDNSSVTPPPSLAQNRVLEEPPMAMLRKKYLLSDSNSTGFSPVHGS
jgi:hypothetical protein